MPITITVEDDRKAWDRLGLTLKSFDGLAGYAGHFEAKLATRGHDHEFGEGVPIREWLGPSADEATGRAVATAAREVGDALDGKQSPAAALETTARVFENAARTYVRAGRVGGKPLSKAAMSVDKRKLVDSGEMTGDDLTTKVAKRINGEDS